MICPEAAPAHAHGPRPTPRARRGGRRRADRRRRAPRRAVPVDARPLWAAIYGGAPVGATAATAANECPCACRHTGEDRLLAWARAVGEACRDRPLPEAGVVPIAEAPFDELRGVSEGADGEETIPIWALAGGRATDLFAGLHAATGEDARLEDGLALRARNGEGPALFLDDTAR